ncbi:hypothetical protein G6F68_013310 [Rhizopus microsporus]|nr:hypothetical protein G6F68_013310 [Rhizopus microsporus]
MTTAAPATWSAFAAAGVDGAVCNDFPGRILNRLVRPYYNAALRRLDEGLASADDMDTTLRLGLGYPEGPIALLGRTGLHHHYRRHHGAGLQHPVARPPVHTAAGRGRRARHQDRTAGRRRRDARLPAPIWRGQRQLHPAQPRQDLGGDGSEE